MTGSKLEKLEHAKEDLKHTSEMIGYGRFSDNIKTELQEIIGDALYDLEDELYEERQKEKTRKALRGGC